MPPAATNVEALIVPAMTVRDGLVGVGFLSLEQATASARSAVRDEQTASDRPRKHILMSAPARTPLE
ncbi:MAG: hypothetical protein AUH72_18615 [Acidobacteria bacterium 13_1_40CM_4_65_8]|nr:MAG: hypothetical protein AUH72_18615 [Acidobacteria bacterium 13_1_40CM_4_65_8]OLE83951.1 MAG: hypothetical protein AUF76_04895 [Acidobacteria bacterium 13_1_20CM_2_65_9]